MAAKKKTSHTTRKGSARSIRRTQKHSAAVRQRKSGEEVSRFPVVGIGASAGGLDALRHLFEHLPVDTGMGFVVVQHLDPNHSSLKC